MDLQLISSVLGRNRLSLHQLIRNHRVAIQILLMHIHRMDLAILIRRIVIDSTVHVAAGAVNGVFADCVAVRVRA